MTQYSNMSPIVFFTPKFESPTGWPQFSDKIGAQKYKLNTPQLHLKFHKCTFFCQGLQNKPNSFLHIVFGQGLFQAIARFNDPMFYMQKSFICRDLLGSLEFM